MKRVPSLRFDLLEARELLSTAHATAHAARAAAAPLVLNGTLTVDAQAAQPVSNVDGSSKVSIPVVGKLGTLGPVHGYWDVSFDSLGNRMEPETLGLRDAKGTFTLEFKNQNPSSSKARTHGPLSYVHPQLLTDGTGAYARATERGTVELTSNATRTQVVSLTLHTKGT
jgi:hypothetical protein